MKIEYANDRVEKQCTNMKDTLKLFGGDKALATSLHARINAIKSADTIKDIIATPPFHFHKLIGDRKDTFAIDVKSRRDKWRIILCPLDETGERFDPCHIDEIALIVRIVEIMEVSAHYE